MTEFYTDQTRAPAILSGLNIICFGRRPWGAQVGTTEQITARLSRTNRVLYIERFYNFLHYLKGGKSPIKASENLDAIPVSNNLMTMRFPPVLPGSRGFKIIRATNQVYLAHLLQKTMVKHRFTDPVLWFFDFDYSFMLDSLPRSLSIYHCGDLHLSDVMTRKEKEWVQLHENKLIERADLIFCTSRYLCSMAARKNPNSFFIPNGVDFSLFSRAALPETPVVPELRELKRPLVGFIGILDDRIDKELISYLAGKEPGWSFVFVGLRKKEFGLLNLLEGSKNMHFLEMQPVHRLPNFLKSFDVCIIPYQVNSYTNAIYPLKIHEYLAAGKPVVTTALEELEELSSVIFISYSKEEFHNNILRALQENGSKVSERQRIAKLNDWESRIAAMSQIILGRIAPKLGRSLSVVKVGQGQGEPEQCSMEI